MPATSVVIPAVPVLVPLAVIALAIVVERLGRARAITAPRVVVAALACAYGAVVLAETLLPMRIGRSELAWWEWVQPVPLLTVPHDPSGLLLNAALFVPLGVLIPLIAPAGIRRVLLIGFLASLAIETTQLVTDLTIARGRIADVDDLIGNTLGAVIGYLLFRVATRVPVLAAAAREARWPRPRTAVPA